MNCNLISYDFIRFFWLKMSLKRAPISSKSSPNFKIELRTSRTLFPSPEVELNELEHLKSRTFRTRTQVRSITKHDEIDVLKIFFFLLSNIHCSWKYIVANWWWSQVGKIWVSFKVELGPCNCNMPLTQLNYLVLYAYYLVLPT